MECQYQRRKSSTTAGPLPIILGSDVAGVVAAVGVGVTSCAVGDEVYSFLLGGGVGGRACAEYVRRRVEFVAHKPRNPSFAQAASMVTTGLTANQCLEHERLRPGEPLFVAGGSGGVGATLIQLTRHTGAGPIFTTTGGERSARYLGETLGVPQERLLFYAGLSRDQLAARLRELNDGRLFRVAID